MPRSASIAVPKLRLHKSSGNAAVMIDGRYLYLGKYGTPEAKERYDRTVAEWLANRRKATGAEAAKLEYEKAEARQRRAAAAVVEPETAATVDEVLAADLSYARRGTSATASPFGNSVTSSA